MLHTIETKGIPLAKNTSLISEDGIPLAITRTQRHAFVFKAFDGTTMIIIGDPNKGAVDVAGKINEVLAKP